MKYARIAEKVIYFIEDIPMVVKTDESFGSSKNFFNTVRILQMVTSGGDGDHQVYVQQKIELL